MKTHSQHEHIEELIEGYALDALEPEERSLVDRHTSICPPCRKQLRVTEETTQLLAFVATPVAPPSSCKRKLLEKIEREQFLHSPTRRSRRAAPLASWAAVAAVLLFMATGAWGFTLQRQLTLMSSEMARARSEIAELEEVLAEVQAIRPLKGEGQAQSIAANTFMKPGSNKAILVIRNLPSLSPGQTYQVWVARDGMQQPLTTFNPPPADDTTQVAITPPEPMDHYKWIMVTIEDAQGADHPSEKQVLFGNL
jgi:hypothetical protein